MSEVTGRNRLPQFLSVAEVAAALRIDRKTVHKLLASLPRAWLQRLSPEAQQQKWRFLGLFAIPGLPPDRGRRIEPDWRAKRRRRGFPSWSTHSKQTTTKGPL